MLGDVPIPFRFWAVIVVLSVAMLAFVYAQLENELERTKHEHARWISHCLHWTKIGCDAEAKFAAEQVVALREEINFLRKILRPWRYF